MTSYFAEIVDFVAAHPHYALAASPHSVGNFAWAKTDRIVAQLSQQSRDRGASASSLLPFPADQ